MRLSIFPVLLGTLSFACAPSGPTLTGQVTDIFGKPLAGAKVVVEQTGSTISTDPQGAFSIPTEYSAKLRIMAGQDGYIKDVKSVVVPANKEASLPTLNFELWDKPSEPGFYGVGVKKMVHLPAEEVLARGSDLQEVHGVRDIPDSVLSKSGKPSRFLFVSTLRSSDISRLNLKLQKLEFVKSTELPALTGTDDVTVELYVATEALPFEMTASQAPNIYHITTEKPLKPGVYAFDSQDLLAGKVPGSLDSVAKEVKVAHVFEIK